METMKIHNPCKQISKFEIQTLSTCKHQQSSYGIHSALQLFSYDSSVVTSLRLAA